MGRKATMITIPTTSGTGSEVTPFAVLSDEQGNKFTVASHNLTPRMAIVDPQVGAGKWMWAHAGVGRDVPTPRVAAVES